MAHLSASGPVLKAVAAALNVAGYTGAIPSTTITVTNSPTQQTAAPFTVPKISSEGRFDRMGSPGKDVLVELHHYSDYQGDAELVVMRSKALELLHYVPLTIDSHTIVQPGGSYDIGIDMGVDEIAGVMRGHWMDYYHVEVVQA